MKKLFFLLLFIPLILNSQTKKISDLPPATSVTGAELIPIYQSGTTKSITPDLLYYSQFRIFNARNATYGAHADGITDDVTHIQSAIDAATTVKGEVYLPAGTYGITNSIILKSNITLKGAGRGQTIIKVLPSWPDANNWEGMLEFALLSTNIKIEDLTLDGNYPAFSADLDKEIIGITDYSTNNIASGAPYWNISHPINISVKNVEIRKTSNFGMLFRSSMSGGVPVTGQVLIDNCYIHNCGDTLYYGGLYFDDTKEVKITKTVIDSVYHRGIYLAGGWDYEIIGNTFTNNGIGKTVGDGISIRADSNVVFTNNIVKFNYDDGVSILNESYWKKNGRVRNIVLAENIISENRATAYPYSQIYIWNGENIDLSHNIIRKSGTESNSDTTYIGIYTIGDGSNITLSDNQINAARGIVLVGDTLTNIHTTGNHISYMTNTGVPQKGTVGIKLEHSHIQSNQVYVTENIIDTCTVPIRKTSDWLATNTIINNNIIPDYRPAEIVTVRKTVAHPGHVGANYTWTSVHNLTPQNLDLGAIIPAKTRIIGVEIICTQEATSYLGFNVGNASAGSQFIGSALPCYHIDSILGITDGTKLPAITMSASTTHIWLQGNLDAVEWDLFTAGMWDIFITYIQY